MPILLTSLCSFIFLTFEISYTCKNYWFRWPLLFAFFCLFFLSSPTLTQLLWISTSKYRLPNFFDGSIGRSPLNISIVALTLACTFNIFYRAKVCFLECRFLLQSGILEYQLQQSNLRAAAAGLKPSRLRFGGSGNDNLFYGLDASQCGILPDWKNCTYTNPQCLNSTHWDGLYGLAACGSRWVCLSWNGLQGEGCVRVGWRNQELVNFCSTCSAIVN